MIREIVFFQSYFLDFYEDLDAKTQLKIDYVFQLIRAVERVPVKFLKHLEGTDGLYEIRVEHRSNIYRIICCFDEGQLVVLFNAFHKKTQKTPRHEIELAEKLKKTYFIERRKDKNG
jgi:phage-related protein